MKKALKKILTAMCAMVLCVLCFTGCSWLQIDKERYYNQIVVTIGDTKFTKKDLVEAFSNYGYQYVQQYGYSLEESVNQTIESMIDRELLKQEIEKEALTNDALKITEQELKELRAETFNYMQDSIKTFEDQVRQEWELTMDISSKEDAEPLRTAETEYKSSVAYVYDNELAKADNYSKADINYYTVKRVDNHEHESVYVPDDLPEHFTKEYRIVTDQKVCDEAWTRYIKSLQDLAKAEGRSTVEADVLLHEEERLFELMRTNKLLEKYETNFLENNPVDYKSVLDYYREQFRSQKSTFADESLYHTAMQKASSEYIYYHVNGGNEYVNVKHILINFNDEQKERIASLDTEFGIKNDNSDEDEQRKQNAQYQLRYKNIINNTKSTFEMSEEMYNNYAINYGFEKVEGKKDTYTAYASDIYRFVKDYATGTSHKERSSKFNELVYVFNDDGGFMNSAFDYVVNLDTNVKDQMVKPFADGVRALDKSNGGAGAGSMDLIASTYGYHIIFHDGVVRNIVEDINMTDTQLLNILCTTYTTPNSNKTIFDLIYDKLDLDGSKYDTMTQAIVADARTKLKANNITIVYYEKHYKDLFE